MNLIGNDTWDCDGYALTPEMRYDILMAFAEEYEVWSSTGFSWEWAWSDECPGCGRMVRGEQNPVNTISDFLSESTGKTHWANRAWPLSYFDWLEEWIKEYLFEKWGPEAYGVIEEDRDPLLRAEDQVFAWLEQLELDHLTSWCQEQKATEEKQEGSTLAL